MKLVKTASGKTQVKMSKKEWQSIGKKASWLNPTEEESEMAAESYMEEHGSYGDSWTPVHETSDYYLHLLEPKIETVVMDLFSSVDVSETQAAEIATKMREFCKYLSDKKEESLNKTLVNIGQE